MTKVCTSCLVEKPLDAFRRGKGYKGGIRTDCKTCEAARLTRWRKTHPLAVAAQGRRRSERERREKRGYYDPTKRELLALHRRDAYLRRRYGISLDDYLAMRDAQNGVCAVCRRPPDEAAEGAGTHPELVVDHSHDTGRVRGLLCDGCNRTAGSANDDPTRLRALADYLDGVVTDR